MSRRVWALLLLSYACASLLYAVPLVAPCMGLWNIAACVEVWKAGLSPFDRFVYELPSPLTPVLAFISLVAVTAVADLLWRAFRRIHPSGTQWPHDEIPCYHHGCGGGLTARRRRYANTRPSCATRSLDSGSDHPVPASEAPWDRAAARLVRVGTFTKPCLADRGCVHVYRGRRGEPQPGWDRTSAPAPR